MIARLALVVAAVALGAAIGVPFAVVAGTREAQRTYDRSNDERDAQSIRERRETRVRGNVVRANLIIDAQDPDDSPLERSRVELISPIIDPVTSRALALDEADLYVRIIARHRGSCSLARMPVIRNRRVVLDRAGRPVTRPFPGPPPSVRCARPHPPRRF